MSESRFPNPITSIFNPAAWDFTLLDRYANFIVAYRYAQSYPIFFGGSPTLTTRTALTQWASTAYATSEIVSWVTANVTPTLGTAKIWAILQYYFGGVAVNTINPLTTGGTLLIGNNLTTNQVGIHSKEGRSTVLHLGDGNTSTGGVHIQDGTNTTGDVRILTGTGGTGTTFLGSSTSTITLNTPLTPIWSNSPVFYIPDATNVTYGKVGAIGQMIYSANSSTIFPSTPNTSVSVTLSVGTWLLNAEVQVLNVFSDRCFMGLTLVPNSDVGMFCGFGPINGYNSSTLPGGLRLNTVYRVTSGTPIVYLMFRGYNFGLAANNRVLTATRLA